MKKSKELVLKLQEGAKLRGMTCIPPDFDRVMFATPCAHLETAPAKNEAEKVKSDDYTYKKQ